MREFYINTVKSGLVVFVVLQIVSYLLNLSVMGFWDGGLAQGLPLGYYVYNCGMDITIVSCPVGFNFNNIILDLIVCLLLGMLYSFIRKLSSNNK
ncbi:MAG TPA: hypothetical protein VF837_03620 [Patescibacteria group bacterium]